MKYCIFMDAELAVMYEYDFLEPHCQEGANVWIDFINDFS